MSLPALNEVDRTRAFTPEEQAEVNKLPRDLRLAYMARPDKMNASENERHYRSSNYPEVKYYSSGGKGAGTLTPPKKAK